MNFKLNEVSRLIVFAIFVLLLSCNSENKTNQGEAKKIIDNQLISSLTTECDPSGLGNITIPEAEVINMRKRFNAIYSKQMIPNNVFTDSFWVSKCFINTIGDYIIANNSTSGVRFIFGAEKNSKGSFSTRLFIIPTQDDNTRGFRNDLWDKEIKNESCKNELDYYYPKFSIASTQIKDFEKEYRKNPEPANGTAKIDSLSKKVWFSRCAIVLLSELLKEETQTDGVNIKLGAYDSFDISKHPGQSYAHQSTIILVPTSSKKDDWSILSVIKNKILLSFDGGLNHGALCPNQCN
jgi:hypothetical protein